MINKKINFVFFGTSEFSVIILDELERAGFIPSVIICGQDKPLGRKMIITPPPTKVWAEEHGIKFFQPKTLREEKESGITEKIKNLLQRNDLFIVVSYGKIIPQVILDIPTHGTLNVHPSLLPKLRGPSPIQSAILFENKTGVSIMLLDALMDHGPVLIQEKIISWNEDNLPYADDLEKILGHHGGEMLAKVLPEWIAGKIKLEEQDHTKATICKKIEKGDGLLNLTDSAEINLRKIKAYRLWPSAYFFIEKNGKNMRINVTEAYIKNGELIITKVIPEGRKEMLYTDFKRGLNNFQIQQTPL